MKFLRSIFPDIISLSKKDSNISTKRYSDLRLINHVICYNWIALITFIYNGLWHEILLDSLMLGALCFARGLLAKEGFLNILKNDKTDTSAS